MKMITNILAKYFDSCKNAIKWNFQEFEFDPIGLTHNVKTKFYFSTLLVASFITADGLAVSEQLPINTCKKPVG